MKYLAIKQDDTYICPALLKPQSYKVANFKSVSMSAPGRTATCHLTDFSETLSV